MFYLDETIHFFHPQENLWIMWITLWISWFSVVFSMNFVWINWYSCSHTYFYRYFFTFYSIKYYAVCHLTFYFDQKIPYFHLFKLCANSLFCIGNFLKFVKIFCQFIFCPISPERTLPFFPHILNCTLEKGMRCLAKETTFFIGQKSDPHIPQ